MNESNSTTLPKPSATASLRSNSSIHPVILNIFIVYYVIVFLLSFVGNLLIISSVYKFKQIRTVVNTFLVNLAIADMLFTALTIFNGLTVIYGKWNFGDLACRIQGTLVELSYTVSVCTLTVVAFERYMSICYPHQPKRTIRQAVKICGLVWMFSGIFCCCLLYGYSVEVDGTNKLQCQNTAWGKMSRFFFYMIHSIVVYLFPLTIMLFSHVRISTVLKSNAKNKISHCQETINISMVSLNEQDKNTTSNHNSYNVAIKKNREESVSKRLNIIKLLAVITITFFVLWTPFIIIRLLMYTGVTINDVLWRVSQLLIFGNAAVNCFIYALMSPAFRTAFKDLIFAWKK